MSGKYRTIVADPPWPIGDFPEWGSAKGTVACPYPTMTLAQIAEMPVGGLAAPEAHLYLWTTTQFLEQTYGIARGWGFEVMYPLVWCKSPRGQGLGGKFASTVEFVLFCRERHGSVRITKFLRAAAEDVGVTTAQINQDMGTSDMAGWWLSELPHRSRVPTVEQWHRLKSHLCFGDLMDDEVEAINEMRHDDKKCDSRWWQWPRGAHSAKPEAFLDLVEQVSPAPRLELFARRARFGWDYAGNESLGTVKLEGLAA